MGAFVEWLEPQVRSAILEMNRKGYATQSSGFHGTRCELQMVDGLFTIERADISGDLGELLRRAPVVQSRSPLDAAAKLCRIKHGLADQREDFVFKDMSADPRASACPRGSPRIPCRRQ